MKPHAPWVAVVFVAVPLAGCLQGAPEETDGYWRVEISTAYDPDKTDPAFKSYGPPTGTTLGAEGGGSLTAFPANERGKKVNMLGDDSEYCPKPVGAGHRELKHGDRLDHRYCYYLYKFSNGEPFVFWVPKEPVMYIHGPSGGGISVGRHEDPRGVGSENCGPRYSEPRGVYVASSGGQQPPFNVTQDYEILFRWGYQDTCPMDPGAQPSPTPAR